MHVRLGIFALFISSIFAQASEIRGKVVSAAGGEPLGRVQVAVLNQQGGVAAANTKDDGSFVIPGVGYGHYTLRVNAVGYRLVTVEFSLAPDEAAKEFEISVAPDNFRRTERVEVAADVFQAADSPAVVEENLTASELRETSTVLADDPFRSIQTMPGVSAEGGNDFFAQVAVMGATYANSSIYLDGILVPAPFHGTDISEGATLSMFTSETVEDIKVLPAAYPEKYGDSVGAALDLHTRDGSRSAPMFRASVGLVDSDFLGEGALGTSRKGSWLASARKSYLGYLLRNRLNDTSDNVSLYDADLKLTYDVTPNQNVSFYGVGGHTFYELLNANYYPSINDTQQATNDFEMARLGWRWSPSPHVLLDSRAAFVQAPFHYWNSDRQPLNSDNYNEWVAGEDVAWIWQKDHVLEGGWTLRRADSRSAYTVYNSDGTIGPNGSSQNVVGWRTDEYVQQSSTFLGNRLHLVGGLRLDTAEQYGLHPVSPQLSAAMQVASNTQLQFGFGRYNQFEFPESAPIEVAGCPIEFSQYQTANHYTAGVEQRLGETTRVKFLLFDRQNSTSESFSVYDKNGCYSSPGYINSERDFARGAQIVLQRRTANRLSGWIGYMLLTAREGFRCASSQGLCWFPYYPTAADQRHTLNVFASYRITPSVHISGKFLFGSGFAFPIGNASAPSRLGDYQRLDVRGEKDWVFGRWKLALYGEVLNLTDHSNPRYFYTAWNPNSNTFSVVLGQGLPILPTAGLAFEF